MAVPILLVTLLAFYGAVIVARRKWHVQAMLCLVFMGAVSLFVVGFERLVDRTTTNDTAGIVLTSIALAVALGEAIATRLLYPGNPNGPAGPGDAP